MSIEDDLEEVAEDVLCIQCHRLLTEEEAEAGHECNHCIREWLDERTNQE